MQSRQKQGPGVQQPGPGRECGSAPFPLQLYPQPSWPLATAQAETEKLGMGGANLMVQAVGRDMALAAQPGQIMI